MNIVIINGRVIDPANAVDKCCDVIISEGVIKAIGKATEADKKGANIIDAKGKIVCPGFIDLHVHTREPGHEEEETIASAATAAAAGGFSTICAMPNTHPPIDNDTQVLYIKRQSELANMARVLPVGCITKARKGKELAEMGMMQSAGAVAFSDDGTGVEDSKLMQRAMQYASMLNITLMQHCEDPSLFGGHMNSGATAVRLGLGGIPCSCEEIMLQRDLELLRRIGGHYHVQHVSTVRSVSMIRDAKNEGLSVTAEATPQHMLLTDAACSGYNPLYKVNPPLRSMADVNAIRLGVADGTIDCLATDHAPHTREEKEQEFALAPFGMISIEAALGLYAKALVETSTCDWPLLIKAMTINPAKIINSNLGTLGEGSPADVTIIDPDLEWVVNVDEFFSKSRNCPFADMKLRGRPITTIIDGDIKFQL